MANIEKEVKIPSKKKTSTKKPAPKAAVAKPAAKKVSAKAPAKKVAAKKAAPAKKAAVAKPAVKKVSAGVKSLSAKVEAKKAPAPKKEDAPKKPKAGPRPEVSIEQMGGSRRKAVTNYRDKMAAMTPKERLIHNLHTKADGFKTIAGAYGADLPKFAKALGVVLAAITKAEETLADVPDQIKNAVRAQARKSRAAAPAEAAPATPAN